MMNLETTIGTQTESLSRQLSADLEGGCGGRPYSNSQSDDLLSHITEAGEDTDDNYAKVVYTKESVLTCHNDSEVDDVDYKNLTTHHGEKSLAQLSNNNNNNTNDDDFVNHDI